MISLQTLREHLNAYVDLQGLSSEQERIVKASLGKMTAQIHRLMRHEVIKAKQERTEGE